MSEVKDDAAVAELERRHERVRSDRDRILTVYKGGTSLKQLLREYGVSRDFLVARFTEWGQPVRNQREAAHFRGSTRRC